MSQQYTIGKVAPTPRGAYVATTTYNPLDIVTYNGSSYWVLQSCTGITPPNATYYQLIASKGNAGTNGSAATIAAGTVTMLPVGSSATVTNSGTSGNAIFDFGIPYSPLADGSVNTAKLANYAVTDAKLADDAVTTSKLADESVTLDKLAADTVAELDNKANIDGSYESMTVGNAEQLVSTVGVEDNAPYVFRTTGGSADVGDRMNLKAVIGGTVAWNQICDNDFVNHYAKVGSPTVTKSGDTTTITVGDANALIYLNVAYRSLFAKIGHKLLVFFKGYDATNKGNSKVKFSFVSSATVGSTRDYEFQSDSFIYSSIADVYGCGIYFTNVTSGDSVSFDGVSVINLTAMFGSAIADYAYTLESGTAGAGIAWLKGYGFFTKLYYPYKAAALESVKTSAHNTVGFNQWDEEWENGRFNLTTGAASDGNGLRSKNMIRVIPNTVYHAVAGNYGQGGFILFYYDANGGFLSYELKYSTDFNFTTPDSACYLNFNLQTSSAVTAYHNDICINLHWDGERDGEYEPYEEHTYALDDVELRGIPKLDASNNLYYDGDRYLPDGTVERRYGVVDLGALTWTAQSLSNNRVAYIASYASWDDAPWLDKPALTIPTPAVCVAFDHMVAQSASSWGSNVGVFTDTAATLPVKSFAIIKDSGTYADAASFKAAMNNVKLVYKIETPTTESADPYTELQICDDFGTEEFVDAATRDFDMPVGHNSVYSPNLRAKLEMAPNSPDSAGDFIVRQTNGTNEYVPVSDNSIISGLTTRCPACPTDTDGTFVLKATVSGGAVTYSWVSE